MKTLAAGTIKRLHVNQHILRKNRTAGTNAPVLTIQHRGKSLRANWVKICGPSQLIQALDKPLSCGATIYVETRSEIHYW